MKNRFRQTFYYICTDLVAASVSWAGFIYFRKKFIEPDAIGFDVPVEFGRNAIYGFILVPFFWVFLSWFSGYYRDIYRKSRLKELGQTFVTVLVGTVILFFTLFIDDVVADYH